jgi:hypothetical protein
MAAATLYLTTPYARRLVMVMFILKLVLPYKALRVERKQVRVPETLHQVKE